MLVTSRWILRVLNWLNWGLGVPVMLVLLTIGFVAPDLLYAAIARGSPGTDPAVMLTWLRSIAILIAPIIPLAHIILTRLMAMIDSVPSGAALSIVNAGRLHAIAWALVGINILDLAFGLVTIWAESRVDEPLGWSFAVTGWLAALMLFVLARVFREGAAMRDELEGTV